MDKVKAYWCMSDVDTCEQKGIQTCKVVFTNKKPSEIVRQNHVFGLVETVWSVVQNACLCRKLRQELYKSFR